MLLDSGGTMTEPDPPHSSVPPDPFAYPAPRDPYGAPVLPPNPFAYPPAAPSAVDSPYGRFEPLAPASAEPPKRRRGLAVGLSIGAAVLVCVAVAAALAGGKEPDPHAVIQTTSEPTAGLGTEVHSHGITIVLPKDWTNLPTTPAQLRAMASAAASTNPALAGAMTQFSTSAAIGNFALLAVRARTDPSAPLEDLDVIVGRAGPSLDAMSAATETQLAASGASDVSLTTATVGSLPAFRLTYTFTITTATGTVAVPGLLFGVIEDGQAAEISFSNPSAQDEKQDILDSFSFH
jgi:hypothetical protein